MFKALTIFAAIAPFITLAAHASDAQPAKSSLTLAGGIAVVPEYAGAQRMRVRPVIDVDYTSGTGFFSGSRGVGYQGSAGAASFSAALTYDPGRRDHRSDASMGSDDLKGMGNIKGAAVAVVGTGFDAGFARFSVDAHLAVTDRQRGNTYVVGVSRPLSVSADNQFVLAATATYADARSAQTYFGVTTRQAAASGYRTYNPSAGFQDAGIALSWNHVIDPRWSVRSLAGATRLLRDAADSPIVRRRSHAIVATTLNYAF